MHDAILITILSKTDLKMCAVAGYTLMHPSGTCGFRSGAGLLKSRELPDSGDQPSTRISALAKTREVESGLRSQLRILQIARLEGWEVARNYAEVLERATEDPLLTEARKRAAKEKGRFACGNENETKSESDNETETDTETKKYNYVFLLPRLLC